MAQQRSSPVCIPFEASIPYAHVWLDVNGVSCLRSHATLIKAFYYGCPWPSFAGLEGAHDHSTASHHC
jgi:hypothetical protein